MNETDMASFLIISMISLAISMSLIPLLIRYAGALGMLDTPDPRKVHEIPTPRVGGIGIVLGALVPIVIWMPHDQLFTSFVIGCLILFVFGVWDDVKELGHFVKFIGQFGAAIMVVYVGGLYVSHFPYLGFQTIPESVGKPFTVFAIIGAINALNHSDGLDGLAGGESMLSFGAIAYMAYLFDGTELLVITCATIGGIFGFLRFNSHPAQVFMGDGGSQFLGFTLAFLVIYLTQVVNPVLSPAIPLLLIGLPIVDILAVFYLRARGGMNLFKATKNHVHHRLLELGFYHHESVMIIYSVQAVLVLCAIMMPYENDFLLTAIYLFVCGAVFIGLSLAEKSGYRLREREGDTDTLRNLFIRYNLISYPKRIVESAVLVFLAGSVLMATMVPTDIALSSLMLLAVIFASLLMPGAVRAMAIRLVVFISVGFAVYLITNNPPDWLVDESLIATLFFSVLTLAVFLAVRLNRQEDFRVSPLDYLVVIMIALVAITSRDPGANMYMKWMALQMIILFYACEIVLQNTNVYRSRIVMVLIMVLGLTSLRGLL